jgi:hypothetical protein
LNSHRLGNIRDVQIVVGNLRCHVGKTPQSAPAWAGPTPNERQGFVPENGKCARSTFIVTASDPQMFADADCEQDLYRI